jgi:pyrroline-5-carboxylate reductase
VCLIKNHWQDPRSSVRKRTQISDVFEDALKAKDLKDKNSQRKIPEITEEDPEVTKVGIIGGGLMGKLLWQLLKDKKISGQRIELSMSTRVPERFFKEVIGGAYIFFDNARIVKENNVVFLCAPKHCCNLIFSDIRAAYHSRSTQTSRALIFSIVGNLPQTKLDKFLNSEKNSLAISANVDFKKVEQSLASMQISQDNGEFVDITQISDQCAFESYYSRAYQTKIWECMHLYTSTKHIFGSGPVFTGIIQLLRNTDNILNKHFYQKIYQKREAVTLKF